MDCHRHTISYNESIRRLIYTQNKTYYYWKYIYRKIPIWLPFKPQKSVLINKVRLLSSPHEIERVRLPKKNKINDLLGYITKSEVVHKDDMVKL